MRRVHKAKLVRSDGRVSALCFRRPRPIDLSRASWTLRWSAVTCPACLAKLERSLTKGRS